MPTNLNALIRYKQIDKELRNPYVKTTIKGLQEACSKQLEEHRGIYKLVSERTIREDIRVMRSDALDFNAPIIFEDGFYKYEDENYSIFNTEMENQDLLNEIMKLLIAERNNIKNSNLVEVLLKLSSLTPEIELPFEMVLELVERESEQSKNSLKVDKKQEILLEKSSFESSHDFDIPKGRLIISDDVIKKSMSGFSSDLNENDQKLSIDKKAKAEFKTQLLWEEIMELV